MEQEVQQTQGLVEQARADLEQITVRLGCTELKSPLTGIVSLRVAREGEFVPAGAPVITVVDLTDVWVRAKVEETLVGRIAIGQPLDVVLASDERLTGKVTFISPEAEFATQRDVDRVKRDIRTFGVKVALENPGGRVHPGMTATVLLPTKGSVPPPMEPAKETSLPNEPQKASGEAPPVMSGTAIAAPVPPPSPGKPARKMGPSAKAPLATEPPRASTAGATEAPAVEARNPSPRKRPLPPLRMLRPVKVTAKDTGAARRRRDRGLHGIQLPRRRRTAEARRDSVHREA
jgi:multidrug efflux pump subunit AcrA (membrane-fusion protein)